ncbi:MAG TPA: prepilin-type N-terminal cleavage/methylation domain-containing protein [Syntrophomonadaceae bacterium]|nr:prepilin-type N-terminal cleavage/methylation domain-containing protein [Syntrophomonadaceae bacterium]
MLMKMRSKMQNQKGFTLVELMVVVVILGILVAIAVPVYNNVTEKAELSAIQANLRTLDGAIMQATVTETGTITWNEVTLKKYITGWPITGPKACSYAVGTVSGQSRAVVTIPNGGNVGGKAPGSYYLVGDVLTSTT